MPLLPAHFLRPILGGSQHELQRACSEQRNHHARTSRQEDGRRQRGKGDVKQNAKHRDKEVGNLEFLRGNRFAAFETNLFFFRQQTVAIYASIHILFNRKPKVDSV